MNIIIKGIHMDITPAVEAYARKKVQSLEKFIDEGTKMEVDLSKTHHHQKGSDAFKADYKVFCKGEYLQSSAEAEDIYSALDLARDELYMSLSSKKDKKMTLWKRGGKRIKNIMRGITSFGKGGEDLEA